MSTKSVYKNSISNSSPFRIIKYQIGSLPGRLANSECCKTGFGSESGENTQSSITSGIYNHCRKVSVNPDSEDNLFGGCVQTRHGLGVSNSGENEQHFCNNQSLNKGSKYSQTLSEVPGVDGFLSKDHTKCQVAHETNPTTYFEVLGSFKNEFKLCGTL